MPLKSRPVAEASKHIGTINTMANGSFQLPYCAASTRNTKTAEAAKIARSGCSAAPAGAEVGPFEADAGRKHLLAELSHALQSRA